MRADSPTHASRAWSSPLAYVALACVVAGAAARFWGLGKWPLAIDEYYFEQSVQNLLHSGIPQFPCGGLYIRGLLLQYAAGALQLLGLSPELSPRLIAAVCSLIVLPAAYSIGRRVGGRETGLLAVAILALSVWEVEIGRFGRMYAPFQAIFVWYVEFFLRYVVDGKRRALGPMLVLSCLGIAVWEGGMFLVLCNLLPPFIRHPDGRLEARDWVYLGACSLLLIPGYFLTMADLRLGLGEPALPPDYIAPPDAPSQSRLDAAVMPWTKLGSHPVWLFISLIPAGLVAYAAGIAVRRYLGTPARPAAALAVLVLLGSAALHQFGLAAGLLLVFGLLGVLDAREVLGVGSRPFQVAFIACVLFWCAFGLANQDWHDAGLSRAHSLFLLGYEFVRFPDVVRQVAMPWARTVPWLALGLFVLVGWCCLRALDEATPRCERVLLGLLLILLMAASASNPPRQETRYVFFLYPLAIIFAITALRRAAVAIGSPAPLLAGTLMVAAAFAASEDFRPWHLLNIDSEAVNFRIGMPGRLAGHYHPRSDVRAAANWLHEHARPGQDLVVISFPGVDFYYREGNYYFVTDTDARFESWSCRRGTTQRWSNLPMIHSYDTLLSRATGRRVWIALESSRMSETVSRFPPGTWTLEWRSRSRDISIVSLNVPVGTAG